MFILCIQIESVAVEALQPPVVLIGDGGPKFNLDMFVPGFGLVSLWPRSDWCFLTFKIRVLLC